jgi:hypothetical protein
LGIDHWLLATGYRLLAIGYWLLAIGHRLLAAGYWLLAAGYRPSAIGYWLLAVGCWLLAAGDGPHVPTLLAGATIPKATTASKPHSMTGAQRN